MNTGSDPQSRFLAHSPSSATHSTRHNLPRSPTSTARLSSPVARHSPSSPRTLRAQSLKGGRVHPDIAPSDAAGRNDESEAETEILSNNDEPSSRLIKKQTQSEKEACKRATSPLTNNSEHSLSRTSSRRPSIQDSTDGHEKRNASKRKLDEAAKSKLVGSLKSRIQIQPTQSPSRAQSADVVPTRASPSSSESHAPISKSTDRARTSSSVEPRKRKLSAEHVRNRLEPPRQRPRLDSGNKSSSTQAKLRTGSPVASPALNGSHRRSASTQSAAVKISRSKKREASTNSQISDGKEHWDGDSSDASSVIGNKGLTVSHLAPPRSGRLASRALNSPVRNAPVSKRRADKYGTTPLAKWCEKGEYDDVVKAYEEAPSELDQADNGGFTPLQKASLGGFLDVVKFLIKKGCKVDSCSKEERDTPLIDAVENDHIEVVRVLLEAGANPHHSNKAGVRAIDAIDPEHENGDEARALLQKAMKEYQINDEDHEQPSMEVSNPARRDNLRLNTRPDLLYQQMTRDNLLRYSTKGDTEAVVMLLESVQADNSIAVVAARGGHYDVLSFILAQGSPKLPIDPDPAKYKDETPLLACIGRGHINVIKLLLDQDGFNPTRRTTDGKTYYEVSEIRQGPKWQSELQILKNAYDEYKESQPSKVGRKKRLSDVSASWTPHGKEKSNATRSPKLSKSKSKDAASEDRRPKRLSNGKDSHTKEGQRRKRRVVEDDSSQDEKSEEQPRKTKTLQRRRAVSTTQKSTKPSENAQSPSGGRVEESIPKETKNPQETRHIKTEPSLGDEDILMDDAHDDSENVEGEADPQIEEDLVKEQAAEKMRQAEADAKLRADLLAIAAENQAKEKAEHVRLQLEEAERARISHEAYLNSLPLAIRHAIEYGNKRPMKLTSNDAAAEAPQRLGIINQFYPVQACFRHEIEPPSSPSSELSDDLWTLSFYLIGLLGISDFTLTDYAWQKIEATPTQLAQFFKTHNMAPLAHDHLWLEMGQRGYSHDAALALLQKTRQQCINMQPMWWIRLEDFKRVVKSHERFKDVPIKWKKTSVLCSKTNRARTPVSFWDVFDKRAGSSTASSFSQSSISPNATGVLRDGMVSGYTSPNADTTATPLVNGLQINGDSSET